MSLLRCQIGRRAISHNKPVTGHMQEPRLAIKIKKCAMHLSAEKYADFQHEDATQEESFQKKLSIYCYSIKLLLSSFTNR